MSRIAINGMLLSAPFSGVEVTIFELAKSLRAVGRDEYHIFIPDHSPVEIEDTNNFVVHRVKLRSKSRVRRVLWEHDKLSREVKRIKADLLHCPGYIAPFRSQVPVVLTVHDCFAITNPEWCRFTNRLYYRLLFERSVRNASKIIVPSQFVRGELIRLFPTVESRVEMIPFGVSDSFKEIDDQSQLDEVRFSYSLPGKFLLFVGNHEPKKNLPGILQAFARFCRGSGKGMKLVLVGGKSWGGLLDSLIDQLGISDLVVRPGYIAEEDLPSVYNLAEALVFTSHSEGFGLPALEAMACGLPVLASNHGALPEVVENAALQVNPEKPEEIAMGLIKLTDDQEFRSQLISHGFSRVKEYSWQQTAKATSQVYQQVLS